MDLEVYNRDVQFTARKTSNGIPQYGDELDIFLLSLAEDPIWTVVGRAWQARRDPLQPGRQ
jgi:hypothetical protein